MLEKLAAACQQLACLFLSKLMEEGLQQQISASDAKVSGSDSEARDHERGMNTVPLLRGAMCLKQQAPATDGDTSYTLLYE